MILHWSGVIRDPSETASVLPNRVETGPAGLQA